MVTNKTWVSPTQSRALTQTEMENNAYIIGWLFIRVYRWTPNAVAGMLGNMQAESSINPNRWQNDKEPKREDYESDEEYEEAVSKTGYGLVQWTPYTKYSNWAGGSWRGNGDKECERIEYEKKNGFQWIATGTYNFTLDAYTEMLNTPEYMADAFLKNYERPQNPNQPIRGEYARTWYNFLIQYVQPKLWYWYKKIRDRSFRK